MQDKFKFRIWDKPTCRMFYDVALGFIKAPMRSDWVCVDTSDGQISYTGDRLKDIEIMQCTGLKDKTGKLIYEGDIIRVQYIGAQIPLFSRQFSNLPKDEIFAIIYDHDWHKFRCENPNYKKTCEIHSLDLDAIQINTENKQYEIIGNIYQNPELLEEN